ncbi:MAG: hypothetical protein K8T25_24115 [Planctomycetia bacterium]|nr:hypothetical protein [Planctomycetia bacterium]
MLKKLSGRWGVVLVVFALLSAGWPLHADAQFKGFGGGRAKTPKLEATAQILPAAAGQPLRLSITVDIPATWHIYSVTQQPGGPLRTQIKFDLPEGVSLAGPLVAAPAATVEHYEDIWPKLPVEEHHGQVTWTAALTLAPSVDLAKLTIGGKVQAQMCSSSTGCVNVEAPFEARIGAGEHAALPDALDIREFAKTPMDTARASDKYLPLLGDRNVPKDNRPIGASDRFQAVHLSLSGQLSPQTIPPGGKTTLTLVASPAKGWHLYALAEREPTDKYESRPTLILAQNNGGLLIGQPQPDRGPIEKGPDEGDAHVVRYYSAPVQFSLPIEVPAKTTPGTYTVAGQIAFMTCSGQACDSPTGASFSVDVIVDQKAAAGVAAVQFVKTSYKAVASAIAAQPAQAAVGPGATPTSSSGKPATTFVLSTRESAPLTAYSVLVQLLAAFAGGLMLNVMPCVLPVIGLKILSFVQQGGESRSRIFALNLWFSLGMMTVFMSLAAAAVLLKLGWADQFALPQFQIVLASVVFVFALSLFGVWEIPIPGFVGSRAAHELTEREGLGGAYAKGILTTLLATPCAGPLMGPALSWAVKQHSTPLTLGMFAMLGLGMALPYLIIGWQPSLIRFLPKPGAWMNTFKQLMGFVLVGTVVWIFSFVKPIYYLPTLSLLLGLALACWWVGRTPLTAELGTKVRAWCMAILIAAGIGVGAFQFLSGSGRVVGGGGTNVAVAAPDIDHGDGIWEWYSPNRLETLRQQGKTVLLDFTGPGCIICKSNEKLALGTEKTRQFMRDHGMTGMVADKGEDFQPVMQLMEQLGNEGGTVPFYAIIPGDGSPVIPHSGPITESGLLELLRQAGPSADRTKDTAALKASVGL